jgi:hypothetical protein
LSVEYIVKCMAVYAMLFAKKMIKYFLASELGDCEACVYIIKTRHLNLIVEITLYRVILIWEVHCNCNMHTQS